MTHNVFPAHALAAEADFPHLQPGQCGRHGQERQLDSQALFAGRGEIVIRHRGEFYRLRETRQGKLILTK